MEKILYSQRGLKRENKKKEDIYVVNVITLQLEQVILEYISRVYMKE